ncbi:MAG: retroviral-like aspartic protease family protein [Spirochaetales bacterium]|nr:retroviral-like aspartic protease family protein [Spirochaetales bacterium]
MANPLAAYTFEVPDNHRYAIVIPVGLGVSLPIPGYSLGKKALINTHALVDTGASGSCISMRFARQFQLKPFSMAGVHSAHGTMIVPRYYVDIYLPNGLFQQNMDVTEFMGQQDFDFIIGMNILSQCDVAITNANAKMIFSFRMPPDYLHIDYEKILKKNKTGKLQKDNLRKYQRE